MIKYLQTGSSILSSSKQIYILDHISTVKICTIKSI